MINCHILGAVTHQRISIKIGRIDGSCYAKRTLHRCSADFSTRFGIYITYRNIRCRKCRHIRCFGHGRHIQIQRTGCIVAPVIAGNKHRCFMDHAACIHKTGQSRTAFRIKARKSTAFIRNKKRYAIQRSSCRQASPEIILESIIIHPLCLYRLRLPFCIQPVQHNGQRIFLCHNRHGRHE